MIFRRIGISALSGAILASCTHSVATAPAAPQHQTNRIIFEDVTSELGLVSASTWKYGGPAVADFDGDGDYDFALTNHHEVPGQLFEQTDDGTLQPRPFPLSLADLHGMAPGDYDKDGDQDLLIALGGGNGFAPRPPVLMRNDGWVWTDVTEEAGLGGLGARGRAVRWLDMDRDGDLDILAINARKVVDEPGPRNLVYENLGEGKFRHRDGSEIEPVETERVLVTDFNHDFIPDLVLFSPLSLWQGRGDFSFENVTKQMLPDAGEPIDNVMAVAEADIDNDGEFDLYLARGKTYYELANNSLEFDADTGRLDLRDEGNAGSDGLSIDASGSIILSDFWHWKRRVDVALPVYLGAEMRLLPAPSEPVALTPADAPGMPEKFEKDGWYLGHLGDGKWRLEWHLSGDLAWGMRASIAGVQSVTPDFNPQDPGVPDLLLLRRGGRFIQASDRLPSTSQGNNWGVTSGDFDNDGLTDLFVHRFGNLSARLPDALLHNTGDGFTSVMDHGASGDTGHGDMGAAFDLDRDGRIDLLNGDDDQGSWHLYRNMSDPSLGNFLTVTVGNSPSGTDAYGAVLRVITDDASHVRRVGSNGATHSQSLLATQHVGLGKAHSARKLIVTWRDGSREELADVTAGSSIAIGD